MMDKDITDPSFRYAPSQNPIDPLNSSSATALPDTMTQQVDFVPSGDDFADTIAKATRQRIADQNNAMMLSMSKAAAGNAEEAAAAQRLGYETGVGADIAARNKKLLEQRLATDRLAQLDLFKRDPVLARMLANKDFAAVAHDDLPNLMESGQQINPDLSIFEEFKIGRERGYKTTERGVTGADMLAASYSGVPIPESLRAKATQQSQEMDELRASGGFAESFGVLEGNIESMIPKQAEMALYGAVAGGLVLGAPTGGIGMVPGMVAGAGMGVMSSGVVQSFQLEGGNLFIDMLDDGIPEETARVAAPIGGAIMAALEILPLKFVTGEAKKLIKREVAGQVIDTLKQTGMLDVTKRFLQSYGIGVTTEVGTELAQDAVGTYVQEIAMLATDPLYEEKWKSEKGRAELAKQFVDTFIEVGQGMAIMGAFLPGANFIGDARRARKAKATRQFFKNIDKNASESKLKGRNPRSYQEWFEEKARGTANHTLFIDIEKLREAMAKNNVSAEQLETILPGVTKAIADAKGMNGIDFAFPTSVYAARLSDIAFGQALQEHMRFDPNDMSIAENNQYVKEREQIVEEMKQSAMELMKADAAVDQSAQAVTDLVTAQLVAAGKYTESEARSMASVASASATVMSARFNMTPLDWHNKYGAKVFGEGQIAPAVPAATQQVAPTLSVVASDKIKAKAAEWGISESQISEAETLASSIADSDWVGLAFSDEETPAEGLARAQQDIAVREKYKDKASSIITGGVLPQDASAKVDARITTKSLEQALAEIEKVFEENRKSVGVRFVSIGLGNNRATVNLQVQLLSETQIREELANRAKAAKQAQAAPLEQAAQPSYPVLAEAWNKYLDGEEYGTTNDLADTVEGLIDSDEAPQGLADALDQFREEQAYDREVGGRGDMDTANKQFESAVQAAAEQMTTPPSALEQAATVSATTYSALDRAVGEVTAKSLAAAGWKEQIKGWVNKGIVKQSEVEWSGLVEYLDMQEGKITKETVSEFLKNNGVKVETVTLGDRLPVLKTAVLKGINDAQAALIELYNTDRELKDEFETYRKLVEADAPRDQLAKARIPINDRLDNEFGTSLDDYIENAYQSGAEAKYSRYVLPGGKNYREVLVTLPVDQKARDAAQAKFGEFVAAGMSLIEAKEQAEKSLPGEFRSSHWDESNVLVHLRMNDRTDADGKRVLFVEEVQSDWGQQGKKVGFEDARGRAAALASLPAEKQKLNALKQNAIAARISSPEFPTLLYEQIAAQQTVVDNLENAAYGSINIAKAPFVETTDGWLNLGLKHVMLEAVNGSYDRVAFVTGAQSAERYDLSKQVDRIIVSPIGEKKQVNIELSAGNILFFKVDKEGKISETTDESRQYAPAGTPLEDVVGKELAEKIMQAERGTFKGNDLKVGGEGMNDFYDKIVPAAINKLLKKYGGEKLQQIAVLTEVPISQEEIEAAERRGDFTESERLTLIYERQQLGRGMAENGKQQLGEQLGFDVTNEMKEKIGQGLPLFQAMPSGKPRATFDLSTFFLTLNTAADLSSYLHEMAHFYMVTYVNIANEPGAPPQITADLQIIFDWLGIKDLAAWNAMTLEEQRKYWEAFGYNHEIYLFEGKSPSVEMQGVFDRFSAWLRKIYKNIRDELNVIYRREFGEDLPMLTPEIRGVMDRMLASEKQIQYAESVNNMTPMFLTQKQSGYDDARWAAYQAMVQEAHDQSVTDLTKASLRQMEWLSNARTRLLKEMQAKHDDIRDKMRSDIAEEVAAEPVYMAMSVLKTGKGRVANGEMVVFSDKYKLNLAIVKTMIPAENLSKLGYGKFGMLSEDGLHPDMVAEMFGFKSGDELVLALLAAKPVKEEVDSRLDARMLAEYGDMNTPAEIEVQVQKALHNEARERFIGVEARFVASATRPVRVMIDAAQQAASTIVNAQKIENIRPSNYAAAEARAARDAADAYKQRQSPEQARKTSYTRSYNEQIAAGVDEATAVAEATKKGDQAAAAAKDRQDAFAAKYGNREPAQVIIRAKQAQVVQNQLVKVSTAALEEVDKALKDFRRFFKADEKIAKNRNMDLVDAARSILAFYGLGKHDKLPSAYTDKLQAYNPEMYKAVRPIIEMSQQAGAGGDYETLTVSEFRMMREVVDALWAQARRDQQAEIAGKMVSVAQIQAELIVRTEEIGVPAEALGLKQALTENQKRIRHLMSAGAVLQRVENWARRFDGPQEPGTVGPATKYIWRPVKNAVTAYKIDKNKYVKKFVELLNKVDLPVGKFRSDELDYTFGVGNGGNGKAELLGAMLHIGNLSNLRKLLIGRGWGSLNADGTLDTSRWDAFVERMINEGKLTKEDFEFLQATWDLLEEIKPIAQKAHRDLYGYYFNEIEAKSFTNRFGTYRGGYVPAKTDAMIVRDAQRQAKMEELEADFRASMPSTGMGFTMGRVEYNEPLSIDLRLIESHIDSVLRFSHIQVAIKDVLKIIGRGKFADNLTAIQPFAINDVLLPWLNRTARQTTSVPGIHPVWDKSWNAIRKRTGIATMMGNLRNAMQQFTGWFPAALLVNKGELKNAMSTYLRNPMKTAAYVASLSPFMNDYMNSQIFVLQDNMNELLINPSKYARFKDWTDHHAYFLQTANQNIVNIVTWLGKYNQVLSEIDASISDSEAQYEAVQQADAAVRLTQGGMSPEDVARFQVGTPFDNSMTQFMGFFNMTANLNADEFVMLFRDLGWRGNKGKLMMIYILGIAAPALVSDAISRTLGQGWDDDDDGYLDDVADWFFGSQARYVAAFVPFGSAALTAVTAPFNNKPYDDRITSSPSITSLEASTIGVGKAIINIADDDKELTGRNVRDVLTLITNATGVPVSVLGRPIGYQVDVERGVIEPTDPIDYMRGLITGVPSAESKKK